MLRKLSNIIFIAILCLSISCSSSKNQITSSQKCKVYLDTVFNKHYYYSDSTRIYMVMPEELKNNLPEYVYEDSKGYTFADVNDEIIEIDADTTNALYMGYPSSVVTQPNAKESITKKNAKTKAKKKVRSSKKSVSNKKKK